MDEQMQSNVMSNQSNATANQSNANSEVIREILIRIHDEDFMRVSTRLAKMFNASAVNDNGRFILTLAKGAPYLSPKKEGRDAILSAEQRKDISKRHSAGESYYKLASEYGVHPSTIQRVCGKQNDAKA